MRRDVLELRRFYAAPLGRAARAMIGRKVEEAWGDGNGLDVLGLGYATPFLDGLYAARRTVAAMPAAQGVEAWPQGVKNRACLVDERALAFPNALFDRILAVHALEEADDPLAVLREVWRVLAPSGRTIIVAASRLGLWSDAEKTPFGHGRPFTRGQLEQLVREAELEPIAWSRALYIPPLDWTAGWAEGFEQIGSRLWPQFSGLILLEAVKQTFAVKPRLALAPARRAAGTLRPAPAGPIFEAGVPGLDDLGVRPRSGSPRVKERPRR
jgi:SAM-dependent methyltransferase